MLFQHCLDFAQLNAKPTNFDLMIGTTQEFEVAVGAMASDISGTVHAGARTRREWVGHELFCRQLRPLEISPSQPLAANVEFAFASGIKRFAMWAQNVQRSVGDRLSNGNRALLAAVNTVERGPDRSFRRPVHVPD